MKRPRRRNRNPAASSANPSDGLTCMSLSGILSRSDRHCSRCRLRTRCHSRSCHFAPCLWSLAVRRHDNPYDGRSQPRPDYQENERRREGQGRHEGQGARGAAYLLSGTKTEVIVRCAVAFGVLPLGHMPIRIEGLTRPSRRGHSPPSGQDAFRAILSAKRKSPGALQSRPAMGFEPSLPVFATRTHLIEAKLRARLSRTSSISLLSDR
jgi:hypothetical protein